MDIQNVFYNYKGRAKYDATNEGVTIKVILPFPRSLVTEELVMTKSIVYLGKHRRAYLQLTKFIPWQDDMVTLISQSAYDLLISLCIRSKELKGVYGYTFEPSIMDELPF